MVRAILLRPRLSVLSLYAPAPVHPHPLLGMLANLLTYDLVDPPGALEDVGVAVAGRWHFNGRKDVYLKPIIRSSPREPWHDGRPRPKRECGRTAGSDGRVTHEGHHNPAALCMLVGQYPQSTTAAQHLQHAPHALPWQDLATEKLARVVDDPCRPGIAGVSRDHRQMQTAPGHNRRQGLPVAEVCRDEDHTGAGSRDGLEVLRAANGDEAIELRVTQPRQLEQFEHRLGRVAN